MAKSPAQSSEDERPFDPEEYNRIVGSAKLATIQVTRSRFDVAPEWYDENLNRKLSFGHELLSADLDSVANVIVGRFRFRCEATARRKNVLRSLAEYVIMYEVHEGADEQAAEAFCSRVGIFAVYPYYRSLVAQLAWAANANLPPLPVIATRGAPIRALKPAAKVSTGQRKASGRVSRKS
jgi:hypothetical protein